jgi:hypothetical protein
VFCTVQAQPEGAVTPTVAVPPLTEALTLPGVTVNVHGAASWFTVSVRPAMVSVPVRGVGLVFGATVYFNHDVPDPELLSTDSHEAFDDADHVHEGVVVMKAFVDEPPAATETVAGETLKLQPF